MEDHVAITGIFAIGRTAPASSCGSHGQLLWPEEWDYPALGVYFADTPCAGHDLIALDYRVRGPHGEPSVVHVDQEVGYAATELAKSFDDFRAGLVENSRFQTDGSTSGSSPRSGSATSRRILAMTLTCGRG